jgi:hypothetical protein
MSTAAEQDGISRREMLRRSGALGVALAVATPAVQSLGRVAAFAETSPPPDTAPSHIQLLVTFADDPTRRGIKYDQGEGWNALERQANRCWDPAVASYSGATRDQIAYLNANAQVTSSASGYRVVLPSIVTVVDAASFDGGACFDLANPDGPYPDGSALVFPKPAAGQGNG